MMKEAVMAGQPTKYKPEYCAIAEDWLGRKHSTESLGSQLDCHKDTIYEWKKVHPAFSDAIKRGEAKRAAKLENDLVNGQHQGKTYNAAVGIFLAKNWLGMRDEPKEDSTARNDALEAFADAFKPKGKS